MKPPQAPAYAFLSTIAKDYGAISTSNDLLAAAWRLVPSNCNYALNLVHNFELTFEYDRAIEVAVTFLKDNKDRSIGFTSNRFTCGDFAMVCERFMGPAGFQVDSGSLFLEWTNGGASTERGGGGGGGSFSGEERDNDNKDHCLCHDVSEINLVKDEVSGKILFQRAIEIDNSFSGTKETLSGENLDLIALLMTVIKIFYLQGKLNALPECYQVVEKARRVSDISLHLTTIRNENAYYMCIAQLLTERVKTVAEGLMSEPDCKAAVRMAYQSPFSAAYHLKDSIRSNKLIYVVGDSHVLPLSWASIKDKNNNDVVLVPKLVTGVKHFHCRQTSEFYTKVGLLNAIKTIPDKSSVMFVLGEIDCREGILRAVERDCYPTIDAGISATISMFIDNILTKAVVVGRKAFTNVYVHPVLPVLKETRHLVKPYNVVYKTKINDVSKSSKNIVWLDCLSEFTSVDDEYPLILKVGTFINQLKKDYIFTFFPSFSHQTIT